MDSFTNEVKYCGAHKLDYSVWKNLHKWATEDKWNDWEFCICDNYNETITIFPWDELRVSPEAVSITKASDFGQFLLKNLKGMKNVNSNAAKIDYSYSDSTSTIDNCLNQINASKLLINDYDYSITPWTIDINSQAVRIDDKSLSDTVKEIIDKYENEKEKNNSMNFNFDFGPVDSSVRMSMYGMAIKNASGTYVAYDAKSGQIMDVDILNFEGANKFLYKMPVALREVRGGDIVVHARKPMFVQATLRDNRLKVLDIYDGEEKTIVPAKSPFGFEFITKVVSFVDFTGTASNSNPFGNMLPFILMGDNKNFDEILPFFFMSGQGAANGFTANPMLMYALMSKDAKMKDMLPFILMMNPAVPGHSCCCGCHEDDSCDKAN